MALVIIGNSGAARECYWLYDAMRRANPALLPFKGFVAWQGYAGALHELAPFELASSDAYELAADDMLAIGIGDPLLRRLVYEFYAQKGASFFTLCHPSVISCPSVKSGAANVFHNGCYLGPNVIIGNGNYFNGSVTIGHDCRIGDFNMLNVFSLLGGGASMGNGNSLAPACQLLPKARMGNGNILAPASVLYKGCRDNCLLAGNPALTVEKKLCP